MGGTQTHHRCHNKTQWDYITASLNKKKKKKGKRKKKSLCFGFNVVPNGFNTSLSKFISADSKVTFKCKLGINSGDKPSAFQDFTPSAHTPIFTTERWNSNNTSHHSTH